VHTFTHFHLRLAVKRADVALGVEPDRGRWLAHHEAMTEALPTVMKKVLEVGLS